MRWLGRVQLFPRHAYARRPWQENAGQPFGVPRSHGCVRMPLNHARWLFHNTPKGTPITIQA